MDSATELPAEVTPEPLVPISVRLEGRASRYNYACHYGKERTTKGDVLLYGVGLEFIPLNREVSHLYPGTSAEVCRRIQVGDRIVQVEGMPEMSHWISQDHTDEIRTAIWGR